MFCKAPLDHLLRSACRRAAVIASGCAGPSAQTFLHLKSLVVPNRVGETHAAQTLEAWMRSPTYLNARSNCLWRWTTRHRAWPSLPDRDAVA
jgi:hypothetical protein